MTDQQWLAERVEERRSRLRAAAYRMLGPISEVDRHLESRVRLRPVHDARVASGGLRVLVAEHVLHGPEIVRVTIGQGGARMAERDWTPAAV